MKKFLKKIPVVLAAAAILFSITSVLSQNKVVAVDPNEGVCGNLVDPNDPPAICQQNVNEDPVTGSGGLLPKIAQIIVFIVGALSVVMIIIGGFRYVISGGDSNGVQGAKNTIIYAVVGLVVALFSQVIVSFVLTKL